MLLADNDLGEFGSVGNTLDHGGRTAVAVAGGIDALDVGLEVRTLAAHFNAVGGHQLGVDLLADGGNDQIAGNLKEFAGGDGRAAAGGVRFAQGHLLQSQLAVSLLDRRGQLDKFHAVVHGQLQFMLVSGHIFLGAAVDDGGIRTHTLGESRGVHGGVARADDYDGTGQAGLDFLLHFLHPADDTDHVALNVQPAGFPCTDGKENVGIAHGFQLRNGGSGRAQLDLNIVLLHQGDVLVDGFIGDAEGGDDVTGHTTEGVFAFKDGGLHTGTAKEIGGSDTRRAAADNGNLLAGNLFRDLDGGHQSAVALLGGKELGVTDPDRLVVEVAGALALAAVGADGARDEGQGVLLGDELQSRGVQTLSAQLHILGNVLGNGAAALTRGDKAVHPGHTVLILAHGQRLDGLEMVEVGVAADAECLNGGGVGAMESGKGHILHLFAHLAQTVVAAGLENGGGHGDGPDTGCEQLVAVEVFRAAGKGNAHFALELLGNAVAHLNGQGEQGAAGHIHLVAGQLAAGGVDGEGVGQLQAEFHAGLVRQRLQTLEHGNSVGPLEIFVEVMLVKDDVVVAHGVQNGAGGAVAENGGVALDEGIDLLLRDQVGGDALNLIGGAAVESRQSDGAGDMGADAVDEVGLLREELLEHRLALDKLGRIRGVLHGLNIGVDLFALDAL